MSVNSTFNDDLKSEAFEDTSLIKGKKKQELFRSSRLHWEQIPRANDPSRPLQEKAINLLAVIVHKLSKTEVVILNNEYLSRITKCKKSQNVNLLKQLDDVLDISFHPKIIIGNVKYKNSYAIKHTQDGRRIIKSKAVLLTQKHFVGKTAITPIEKSPTEEKKNPSCSQFPNSYSLYKERKKDRSMKSNVLENSFEEENIPKQTTDSNCLKTQASKKTNVSQIKHTFAKAKELKDFYPISKEDCQQLQSNSGREFTLNAMNQILLDMSKRLTNRFFNSKKGFMSYMSKVYQHEMRDAVKVSDESFKIKNNQSQTEQEASHHEQYLTKIENNRDTSLSSVLARKLAGVLEPSIAYKFLSGASFPRNNIPTDNNTLKIKLHKKIELSSSQYDFILTQVKAVYGNHINSLNLELKLTTSSNSSYQKNDLSSSPNIAPRIFKGVWGRVRQALIDTYGEATDRNWFAKLEVFEDKNKSELRLKAPTSFVRDWISQNYQDLIEKICTRENYQLAGVSI